MSALLLYNNPVSAATTLFTEGFEGGFPPSGWTENSIEQSSTYTFNGAYSAKFSANSDYLITPAISNATTFIFWSYTTAADPQIIVEQASSASGPWTEFAESPFAGDTEQWNGRWVTLTDSQPVYIRLRKDGTGSLYIDDAAAEKDDTPPANSAPVLAAIGNQSLPVSNALNFTVSATDIDNDPIVLSASNLPPGAVFNTVTHAGSVSNVFSWTVAAPTGTYTTTFYADDGTTNDFETITITVTNPPVPPPPEPAWNVIYNTPYQSGSADDYPGQFKIRDALVERINALESGESAVLATFTFSAEAGAGAIINAMAAALDRGASISFIADGDINLGTVYGGTNSLLTLSTQTNNPLILAVDGSTSGIMHDKLGLFDYGGTNQWVFIASWNFTLGASANQWNIALEARSPELYAIYTNETAEFLGGRFHDDATKSHAHDGSTFALDGSWGTNFARFSPPPDGNRVEDDILAQIDSAQSNIVFALNKLNREPIRDALIAAAGRGVEIRGVMPRSDTDPGGVSDDVYNALTNVVEFFPAHAKADYSELDSGEQDLIHAKYMVIDSGTSNAVVIHGSANWTAEALVNDNDNDENTVFLRHNAIADAFHEHFERITGTGAYSEGNSTLVSWNFEDADQIADGGIAANATQTVVRVPAPSSYAYTVDALSCSGWNSGSGTKYWETSFSTIDHVDIKVSSVQLASGTGPSEFKLQYKLGDSGIYADVPYSEVHVPDGGNGVLTRVLLADECNNQPSVFLRWIMTSDTAARDYDDVQSGGRGSIDDIIITGTAYNQPPVFDPISDQVVFEGELLTFSVTASDPIDGDPVTLSATNLPTGSAFTNGTLTWSTAAPVGQCSVTFSATDKDGSSSKTVTITVLKKPLLLISEIADPSESAEFRFVELYNAGPDPIDLAANNWTLSRQNNGGGTWYDIALTGTVAAAGTYVIAKSPDEFLATYGIAPQQEGSAADGNGNDAYCLFYGGNHDAGILIDLYGEIDTDGLDTAWDYTDSRAVRNNDIAEPNITWTATEWTIRSEATTSDMTPSQHGPLPEIILPASLFVFSGDSFNFSVRASNRVDAADIITLSATNLPAGAAFTGGAGIGSASGQFTWNAPDDGEYTVLFTATGKNGSSQKNALLTVSDHSTLNGWFYRWKGRNQIYELSNGQFWQQTSSETYGNYGLYQPDVYIEKRSSTYRMTIPGVTGSVEVRQLQNTISTRIDGTFSGCAEGNIIKLKNATWWRQTSDEDSVRNQTLLDALVWENNGVFGMLIEGEDDPITVEPIAVTENDVTGLFTSFSMGRYKIYTLDDGTTWKQTSSSDSLTTSDTDITAWRWTEDGAVWIRFVDSSNLEVGTCRVEAEGAPANPAIISRIDGYFRGWKGQRVFALQNGEYWRQTTPTTVEQTLYNPLVILTNILSTGTWQMRVEGALPPASVDVEQLTDVTRLEIDGWFHGFQNGNFFRLSDNTWWRQTSSEILAYSRYRPDVLLYSGTRLEMTDLGTAVEAERLDVQSESSITSEFTGLAYANTYTLNNLDIWQQRSKERTRTAIDQPSVMLWLEDNRIHLLVRDELDQTLGTCTVIDPDEDADGDQIANAAELIAGTDPDDAGDLFLITDLGYDSEGRAVLSWNSMEGRTYTVEWTPSLSEAFQPLETGIVWPQSRWTDSINPPNKGCFYRICVQLTD